MAFFLANPWGLLALLGVPAVLAIHLLRRQSQRMAVSTLFLLERIRPVNEGGRRLRRLRNSLPLWLQLLAVLILTWLLAQPRWFSQLATQTVVAVLDDSASMSAFREEVLQVVDRELHRLDGAAGRSQWIVLTSGGDRLASGDSLSSLLPRLGEVWHPRRSGHDPAEALRLARVLAGEKGTVVFFTDVVPADDALPAGTEWVASGGKVPNAGFLGAETEGTVWTALIRNFDDAPRTVRWKIDGEENWRETALPAQGTGQVSGAFPPEGRVVLRLEDDRFAPDNVLPVLLPRPKTLAFRVAGDPVYESLFQQLGELAEPAVTTEEKADVVFSVYDPLSPNLPEESAVVLLKDSTPAGEAAQSVPVSENHPFMESLNWQGLLVREGLAVPFQEGDQALLWQGNRPLIFLRTAGPRRQLIFNFDLRHSNAARLPAFPILLHRFLARLRQDKPAFEAANVETGQWLQPAGAEPQSAPVEPVFFAIVDGQDQPLFEGAAQFADARESDFGAAAAGRSEFAQWEVERQRHAVGAFLEPILAALLAGLLAWNWALTGGGRGRPPLSHRREPAAPALRS